MWIRSIHPLSVCCMFFLGERWSFCGVYDFKSSTCIYLAPSTALDQFPIFSPDDEKVAFVRVTPDISHVPGLPRAAVAEPWRVMVADIESQQCVCVWQASPGAGSRFVS